MYVPLWCKSNFSFLEGASHPEELVEQAHRLGLPALALTDRDGLYGVVRAHVKAQELGIALIIGAQVTVDDGSRIILLVQDHEGYGNLCRLLSAGRLRSPKGESSVGWGDVAAQAPGLIALWGGEGSRLVAERPPDPIANLLKEAYGDRLYALLVRHGRAEDVAIEARLRERAGRYGLPIAAGAEVLYHSAARRPLQDVLTCIRHGITVHDAGNRLKPNAEYDLKSIDDFNARFADDPAAVALTRTIAARCTFSLRELRYRYPSERLPDGSTSSEWLRTLTFEGARKRYPDGVPPDVTTQIETELALIEGLDYSGYFLTMYEIVEYCRAHDILCQGRGSAANSVVCYCLGITAVDPVRMGLLFERFISKERAEPPDIDLDIEHARREEVIQHVYTKYGREHAAMVAVVITYRSRSAMRDVGRALGLPETELGRLAKLLDRHGGLDEERLRQNGLDLDLPAHRHLVRLSGEMRGFPRHLSIHPGGFLLGHQPVTSLVPVENATMPGRTVIQWDKNDVDALGLFKVDLLGLGALHHLHRCFDLIAQHRQINLTMATVPADDPATYAMIGRADTVGVFQIESRAQMSMLPRLKPKNYYDLVIEISLVRPGPITGGMVHPYLRRRNGIEAIDYPHESLIPVLERTLGVPLFQEQVMRLAIIAADYTPGEADQLRRDMAAWHKSGRIERHRERLVSRMQTKGIAPEFAERVFKQIEGFGEYGFPEAHAASFALICYVGAWLKCHYPAEFTCALFNSLPMGFYSAATIVEDAKRHGIVVRPVDVHQSQWDCTLEPLDDGDEAMAASQAGDEPSVPFAIRMGLRFVRGMGEADWRRIEAAAAVAPFDSLEAFVRRTRLPENVLVGLAEGGAFDGFGLSRRHALWEVRGLVRSEPLPLPVGGEDQPDFAQLSLFETITWDYQRTGHSSHGHPLGPLRPDLAAQGLPSASQIAVMPDGHWVRYAGLVICRQRPGTASGVTFMTMEDETGFVNLVLWPKVFERYAVLAKTQSFLGVSGRLQVQEGIVHLIAERLWAPEVASAPATAGSRDFH